VFKPAYDDVSDDESGFIRKSTGEYIPVDVNFPGGRITREIQDPKTKIVFTIDPDGHHLSATRPDGKMLWKVDSDPEHSPAGDSAIVIPLDRHFKSKRVIQISGIGFYLVPKPMRISLLGRSGEKEEDFIEVGFSDHEWGAINKLTGEYVNFPTD